MAVHCFPWPSTKALKIKPVGLWASAQNDDKQKTNKKHKRAPPPRGWSMFMFLGGLTYQHLSVPDANTIPTNEVFVQHIEEELFPEKH